MILSIGEELPSAYLDSFRPQLDIPTRVSILSLQCVALDYHYLDLPQFDVKVLMSVHRELAVMLLEFATRPTPYLLWCTRVLNP